MKIPKPTDEDKERFQSLVPDDPRVEVKPMFGNLGAFVNGNMFMGLFGSDIGVKLADELRGYPGVEVNPSAGADAADLLFVPLVLRMGDHELTFFSTLATFGTALDITLSELAIESFFPADDATAAVLRAAWVMSG